MAGNSSGLSIPLTSSNSESKTDHVYTLSFYASECHKQGSIVILKRRLNTCAPIISSKMGSPCLRRRVVQFRIVMFTSYDALREKLSHFDLKVESLVELTFALAKWVTEEYLSQIDSTLRVKLAQH